MVYGLDFLTSRLGSRHREFAMVKGGSQNSFILSFFLSVTLVLQKRKSVVSLSFFLASLGYLWETLEGCI